MPEDGCCELFDGIVFRVPGHSLRPRSSRREDLCRCRPRSPGVLCSANYDISVHQHETVQRCIPCDRVISDIRLISEQRNSILLIFRPAAGLLASGIVEPLVHSFLDVADCECRQIEIAAIVPKRTAKDECDFVGLRQLRRQPRKYLVCRKFVMRHDRNRIEHEFPRAS